MPNNYNSSFTGQHNDEYDARITALENFRQTFLDTVYPVGSIYISMNETDPGTLFGGTWEQIQDKFLLSAGSTYAAGTTGGTASVTSGGTAITIAQMPAHDHGSAGGHTHTVPYRTGSNLANGSSGIWFTDPGTVTGYGGATGSAGAHTHTSQGSGQAHTHTVATMPPYLTVAMWKRTA